MTITRVKSPTKRLPNGHAFQRIASVVAVVNDRHVIASVYANQVKRGPLYLSLRWHGPVNPREFDTYTPDILGKVQRLIREVGGLQNWNPS